MDKFAISSTARKYPRLPYEEIKDVILGKQYQLSLTFVGTTRAQQLNKTYRKKTYAPNVLSFPLDKNHGEIVITPIVAKREAPKFGLSAKGYVAYLFIHGCLHLKGYGHGDTMDKLEKRYMQKFNIT